MLAHIICDRLIVLLGVGGVSGKQKPEELEMCLLTFQMKTLFRESGVHKSFFLSLTKLNTIDIFTYV